MKKITRKRLENIAVYYLERYDSSSGNLKKILKRRVQKYEMGGAEVPQETAEWIDEIVQKMVGMGYVNEDAYKERLVESLKSQGKSPKQIRLKLMQKSLEGSFKSTGEDEIRQALVFIRKKRLGAYRRSRTKEDYSKDMQKMALAGFSYSAIRIVLDFNTLEEIDGFSG